MGRLYYGEFGVADPVAILDTIGVDPERPRAGIGRAMLEQFKTNLRGVGIETIQTQAAWNQDKPDNPRLIRNTPDYQMALRRLAARGRAGK